MAERRGLPEPPDPLEYELQEARAMSLGQAGRKLEKALAALDAAQGAHDDALVDAAADAVWELLIVRESLRFFNHKPTLEAYGVPPHVIARVGVVRKR